MHNVIFVQKLTVMTDKSIPKTVRLCSNAHASPNRMTAQQRILTVIKLQLLINISKVSMQNFWCAEKIFADYRKKFGRTGCCIRVNTDAMVMFNSLYQAFISCSECN